MKDETPWLRLQCPDGLGPAAAALALRGLLVFALIGIALAGHWFNRGGLRDNIDGDISFVDVVYFAAITVATVGPAVYLIDFHRRRI